MAFRCRSIFDNFKVSQKTSIKFIKIHSTRMAKKILIISMTVGSGHVRAGKALVDYADKYLPQVNVEHLDAADIASPLVRLVNQKFYEVASHNFPKLWGDVYKVFDHKMAAKILSQASHLQEPFCRKLIRYIISRQPDAVIFTYIGIAQLLAPLCRRRLNNIKIGIVVTDYHGHSFYNLPSADCWFVADSFIKNELAAAGVPAGCIRVSGMPVNPAFYAKRSVSELKIKYGIPLNRHVILMMPNFLPSDEIEPAITALLNLKPQVNLIIITSGNKELYYKISLSPLAENKNVTLINWTDAPDEFMRIADVVISKPGGMTISECISLGKPLVMINPIPGQEEANARFMEQNKQGVMAHTPKEIAQAAAEFLRKNQSQKYPIQSLEQNSCKTIFDYFLG